MTDFLKLRRLIRLINPDLLQNNDIRFYEEKLTLQQLQDRFKDYQLADIEDFDDDNFGYRYSNDIHDYICLMSKDENCSIVQIKRRD